MRIRIKNYIVDIDYDEDDKLYRASVEACPGLTAEEETWWAVREAIKQAIENY